MLIKQAYSVLFVILIASLFSACTESEKDRDKIAENPQHWKLTLKSMEYVTPDKEGLNLQENEKLLSLKVEVENLDEKPKSLELDQVLLATASGKKCKLYGIGMSSNAPDEFNIYMPWKPPFLPISTTLVEGGEDRVQVKHTDENSKPLITFLPKHYIVMFGFIVEENEKELYLNFGAYSSAKIVINKK